MTISVRVKKRIGAFSMDMAFESSEKILGVFGPSGSGKTTLMRLLAGLARPDEGEIAIDRQTVFSSARGIDVPARERGLGYVFQDGLLFPHMDVRQNLLYGRRRAARKGVELEDVSRLLDLSALLDRRPETLSGGEARRALIGRALMSGPRALLFDEPFAGLDGRMKERVLAYLTEAVSALDIPLVYISHSLEEIMRLTRRVLVIESGRTAFHGEAMEAVDQAAVYGLIAGEGAVSHLEGTVEAVTGDGAALVRLGNQTLRARALKTSAGRRVLARIAARDVILSLAAAPGLSARNRLAGRLMRAARVGEAVLCHIDVGQELTAEITPEAFEELQLAPGKELFCIIKSNSIRLF